MIHIQSFICSFAGEWIGPDENVSANREMYIDTWKEMQFMNIVGRQQVKIHFDTSELYYASEVSFLLWRWSIS